MVERRFGGVRRPFDRLFSGGSLVGLSDASLLDRYVADHDDDAFAILESRHGPLVWSVCQSVLRDPVDAEDAFQATFLILARQARSLRVEGSLAGWLYRVAHRVAVRASVESKRRRARETAGVNLDAIASPVVEGSPLADLHEAIARLPERFRQAVVLCELEGMTQVEASRVLRCGEATLRRRLASARERLRVGLVKQGEAVAMLALARLSIQTSTALAKSRMIPSTTAQFMARKPPRSLPRSSVVMPSRTLPRPLLFDIAGAKIPTRSVEDGIPTRERGNEDGRSKIERDSYQ